MRRHFWILGIAAAAGVIASFLIVSDNYFLGAIMGALAGIFVIVFIRAWPHDLDPRERGGNVIVNLNIDGKNIPASRYDRRARSGRP
jgi:hypothetical protein